MMGMIRLHKDNNHNKNKNVWMITTIVVIRIINNHDESNKSTNGDNITTSASREPRVI